MNEREDLLARAMRLELELGAATARTDGSVEARVVIGPSPTLYVAGHTVRHWRNGAAKLGELGTGSLALEASRVTSASAFISSAPAFEGVSHAAPHGRAIIDGLVDALPAGPRLAIDIHGMRGRSDGIEVLIGVGRSDVDRSALRWAVEAARAGGLTIHFDREGPYAASGAERLVAHLAARGVTALQIELAPELRDPVRAPNLYLAALDFLVALAGWPASVAPALPPVRGAPPAVSAAPTPPLDKTRTSVEPPPTVPRPDSLPPAPVALPAPDAQWSVDPDDHDDPDPVPAPAALPPVAHPVGPPSPLPRSPRHISPPRVPRRD